jgi:outer membrane receptor protein involved in Fe transport
LRHTSTITFLVLLALAASLPAQETTSIYDLTLEELINLRVSSGASLTKTEAGKTPASVTLITREMIEASGARRLDELLEIYVPNLIRLEVAGGPGPKVGLRGIVGGRSNKTLLLVNGRIMNQRTIYGAISERFMPMLGDIESIEVVRGPGSSVYGPGAINGVISIRTSSQAASDGLVISFRQGFIEGYTMGEVRYARTLGARSSVFGYYGVNDYRGSDPADSPMTFSRTKTLTSDRNLFTAGVAIDSGIVRHNKAFEGQLNHKAHLEVRRGNTHLWARFVRGGLLYLPARSVFESQRKLEGLEEGLQYQQVTVQGEHTVGLGSRTSLQLRASYDIHDVVKDVVAATPNRVHNSAFREDELNARSLVTWTPRADHSVAAGVEYSHEWFGKGPWGLTDDPAHNSRTDLEPWTTNLIGFLGEYQWNASARWTAFLGGRLDKHSFTGWLTSPKVAIVFSPTESYTAKLLYNRSVRKSDDFELKQQHDADPDSDGEVERVDSFELRHDYRPGETTMLSAAAFWQEVDIIGWVGAPRYQSRRVGTEEIIGLEAEASYEVRRHRLSSSYAFTKLRDFSLADEAIRNQTETSAPYGYGNDLHHFPRHVGKLAWRCKLYSRLTTVSSLRLLWGFHGARHYAEYNNEVLIQNTLSRTDDGRTNAFEGTALLNLGADFQVRPALKLGLRLHNVLGWMQQDLNKRNFYGRMAGYRVEAPAISLRIGYTYL